MLGPMIVHLQDSYGRSVAGCAAMVTRDRGRGPRSTGLSVSCNPIHKVVGSEEASVIPSPAPDSALRGSGCGSINIAVLPIAKAPLLRDLSDSKWALIEPAIPPAKRGGCWPSMRAQANETSGTRVDSPLILR